MIPPSPGIHYIHIFKPDPLCSLQQQLDPLLRRLAQTRGKIQDLQLTKPTLEDVFIKVAREEL